MGATRAKGTGEAHPLLPKDLSNLLKKLWQRRYSRQQDQSFTKFSRLEHFVVAMVAPQKKTSNLK